MEHSIIQSTINAIEKPVIFLDLNYRIQAVNQAYQDIYSSKVILGESRCYEISHKSDKPCDQHGENCPMKNCLQTAKATSVVHIHHTEKGKQFCDILMRPVKNKDNQVVGFLEILENINYASVELTKNKMVGESEPFLHMLKQVNRASRSDIAVLLQGETGTGKELVAKALHDGSNRSAKPFVVIECTGLTESLFESELFGHEKGAFTGATHAKKGLIEVAAGGTVFFDEIGDIPLNMQVKLLRLLETKSFRPVGGLQQKKTDYRFLSASHKDLKELVKQGRFREDLYYRISGFPIHLPPLRERKSDIKHLINYFLTHSDYHKKAFSESALTALEKYDFPGNIRELRNVVEQSSLLADEDVIVLEDLPPHITEAGNHQSRSNSVSPESQEIVSLEENEKKYLSDLLVGFDGSIEELAAKLNISTRTLYRKLTKHQLKVSA